MTEMDTLNKLDILRERADISYEEAKKTLEAHDGSVVEALIALEREDGFEHESFMARGTEVVEKARELLRTANVTKIRVKQDQRTILELPVTAGVVGAVFAPELAIIGAVAALATKCTVEVERAGTPEGVH